MAAEVQPLPRDGCHCLVPAGPGSSVPAPGTQGGAAGACTWLPAALAAHGCPAQALCLYPCLGQALGFRASCRGVPLSPGVPGLSAVVAGDSGCAQGAPRCGWSLGQPR